MKTDYDLDVTLKEKLWKVVFAESYQIQLSKEFVENTNPKTHGFQNHIRNSVERIKLNDTPLQKQSYHKWDVFVVRYGLNDGSEINGDRPSIIYKASHSTLWDDVIVIPLTSAVAQKNPDKYDVIVPKDTANKLFQNSFARLRQMRSLSVKKLGKCLGVINDAATIQAINEWIMKMLGTEA